MLQILNNFAQRSEKSDYTELNLPKEAFKGEKCGNLIYFSSINT